MINLSTLLALAFSILSTAVAQLLLKLGMSSVAAQQLTGGGGNWQAIGRLAFEPRLLIGIFLYGAATLSWLYVLSRLPLSLAYPFVGLSFLLVLGLSVLVLGEAVSMQRLLGTLLVACGVVMVALSDRAAPGVGVH
ncbi:membrane protein [Sphingomonas sp. DBB INV C78]|uniref:EamA family transporter n=1 Tax=Sphingomonas sp. DBB INV C78 TaxID=3349434 RepID=UPI0036D39FCB